MKLKLLFVSIFLVISFVAYKQYQDFSVLKSINSYESCLVAKGSLLQESYPATCVTRLGTRFTQPAPILIDVNSNNNEVIIKNIMKFKLPVGWEYSVCSGGKGLLGIIVLGASKQSPACPLDGISGAIEIIFSDYVTPVTTTEMGFEITKKADIVIDHSPALRQTEKVIDGPLSGETLTSIYINKEDIHLTLQLNDQSQSNEFNQILSNLHFLD